MNTSLANRVAANAAAANAAAANAVAANAAAANASTANASAANASTANAFVNGLSTHWILITVCLVFLVGGLVLYYVVKKESNPWYTKRISWMNYLFGNSGLQEVEIATKIQGTESPVPPSRSTEGTEKPSSTWCFVGEDTTGRWCVEVPVPSLCEPIRSYGTRSSCEMTLAQQLPSGISTNNGTASIPMASLSVQR